jgi:hypothetical protein
MTPAAADAKHIRGERPFTKVRRLKQTLLQRFIVAPGDCALPIFDQTFSTTIIFSLAMGWRYQPKNALSA